MPSMKLYLSSMLFLSYIYIYILSRSHCSPASKYPYRWWTPHGSLDTSCVGSSTPHPAAACNAESVSALRREVPAAAGDLGNHCFQWMTGGTSGIVPPFHVSCIWDIMVYYVVGNFNLELQLAPRNAENIYWKLQIVPSQPLVWYQFVWTTTLWTINPRSLGSRH